MTGTDHAHLGQMGDDSGVTRLRNKANGMKKPKRARLPACIARWEIRKCALAALILHHPQMAEGLDAVKGSAR